MYAFIEMFAPQLDRRAVDRAMAGQLRTRAAGQP
jgi:hypothetical protein